MNAIDYYREFIKVRFNFNLVEIKDVTNALIPYNNYLYIYKDELKGPEKIITTFNGTCFFKEEHIRANKDIYIVFIPYNEYTFMFEMDVRDININLHCYNNKKYINRFYNVKDIINFLEIEKLNEAFKFLITTLQIMYNISLNLEASQYVSRYESLIERSVDYYMWHFNLPTSEGRYYSIYSYLNKELFLNIGDNGYTIDKHSEGICIGTIYSIEIDKVRNILIVIMKERDTIEICYYKDNQIVYDISLFLELESNLKMIFSLLGRKDIYRYLKQIRFFERDVFYAQD